MRFFGRSQQHAAVLNFSTWAPSLVEYFKTGVGFVIPAQLQSQVETLPNGYGAALPGCLAGETSSITDKGSFALTDQPFGCSSAPASEWNVGVGGKWSVDALNLDKTHATLHQVWVRPSVYRRNAFTRSAMVLNGSRLAVMSHPNLTTVYDAPTGLGSGSASKAVVLPFTFKFFSVNYGTGGAAMNLADNGYIALGAAGAAGAVTTMTNASFPGAGLFLGLADRSLLFYGLTTAEQTEGGLTYATAVLRFYSNDTGVDEDQVNLEVTFAKKGVHQFIEIRAGSISYDTAGPGNWSLSDGHQFLVNSTVMPALYSGESMVLQSDSEGRYWVPHVNCSLNIREPPAPSTSEGAAACRLLSVRSSFFWLLAHAACRFLGRLPVDASAALPPVCQPCALTAGGPLHPPTHTPQETCPRAAWG